MLDYVDGGSDSSSSRLAAQALKSKVYQYMVNGYITGCSILSSAIAYLQLHPPLYFDPPIPSLVVNW